MRFPIVIHKDRNSGYGVTVPDLPATRHTKPLLAILKGC